MAEAAGASGCYPGSEGTMEEPVREPPSTPDESPEASGPVRWVRGLALAMAILGLVTGIGWLIALAFLAP